VRAKWEKEETGRGGYQIVVTEMPYQVQKSRLIEKIAELLIARRLPLLDDVRDEIAEDVRLVLVPKSRTVDPNLLMESLFKLTDLENRIPLNMNVLSMGKVPKVMNLAKCCANGWRTAARCCSAARATAWRPSNGVWSPVGFLIAYLNLDEVIRIIRFEDDPKRTDEDLRTDRCSGRSHPQLRLRALRKLEEVEIRKEFDGLMAEKEGDRGAARLRRQAVADGCLGNRQCPQDLLQGNRTRARRTTFAEAPARSISRPSSRR
jgi:topoisomerase-4 subunit A